MGLTEMSARPDHEAPPTPTRRALAAVRGARLRDQLLAGLAVLALAFTALVALGINGSSSGALYSSFYAGENPDALLGGPKGIRSDEWLVITPLTISQVENGLPAESDVFPGGMDATIVWDMPYREWSVLLRPHQWGFFVLPLDNAFAFKWWLPFFGLAASGFVLLCTLWRRPLAALGVAGMFTLSPFMQWWFLPNTFWPAAAALAACAAVVLLLEHRTGRWRWPVAMLAAYLVVVAVVPLYPPFLIPCIVAALGFAVGAVLARGETPVRERLRRLVPLGVGAVAAGAVTALFLAQRSETVEKVLGTVYPGERLTPTGTGLLPWQSAYAGVFAQGLRNPDQTGFTANSSEGSSFLFLGLYLLPVVVWLLVRQWRRRRTDWLLLGSTLSLGVLVAFVYVPGWDALAHLLLLDRTTENRSLIGFGVASLLILAVVVHRLDTERVRAPWWLAALVAVLVVGQQLAVLGHLREYAPQIANVVGSWPVLLALLVAALVLFSRRWVTPAALCAAVLALAVAGSVNPIMRGVLDLRETEIGRTIEEVDSADPGSWVAIGGADVMALLRESGVEAYSGVQPYPSDEMWEDLDPDASEDEAWNRYAHVNWTLSEDAEDIQLAQADVVVVRFDSCEAFEQEHVDYVVSTQAIEQPCVRLLEQVTGGASTFFVYTVTPEPAVAR